MFAFIEREGIDGFFTDFTATAVAFRDRLNLGVLETLDIPIQPGVCAAAAMSPLPVAEACGLQTFVS